jgi:DNA-binding winged helix-turn-helix (wHTH) protein
MGTQVHSFAGIEVEPVTRCIRRAGETIYLRPKALHVLLYLLENRDRPVSKAELIQTVWEGASVTENALAQCIIEIRKALGDDLRSPRIIKNLPKYGYRFMAEVQDGHLIPPAEPDALPTVQPAQPARTRIGYRIAGVAVVLLAAGIWLWTRRPEAPVPDPPIGEVARWRFSDGSGTTARDSAGKSPGRLDSSSTGGTPPRWVAGRQGTALSFGGGNFVEGQLNLPVSSAVSLAVWTLPQDVSQVDSTIFDSPRVALRLTPSGIGLRRSSGGPGCGAAFGCLQAIQDGKWRHIVAVDEGPITNMARIYVDGVEKSSGLLPPLEPSRSDMRWRIGHGLNTNSPFRGLMEDLRIYARPLQKLEIEAIYRCGKEQPDITVGGKPYYYLPVFADGAAVADDGSFTNRGPDVGGIQLAEQNGDCGVDLLRGADLGQDLSITMDLSVLRDAQGHTTEAGPYFRSRRAYPGDGIVGGTSSGYWVKLYSSGEVRVFQLRPLVRIGVAPAPEQFDSGRFHHLEAEAKGAELRVWLDGAPVMFEQDGHHVQSIAILGTGTGRGTAGVAFSADANRGAAGGQRVKNLKIDRPGSAVGR